MASNNGLAEQLTKLAKLHVDGGLTDEEFQALKVKLIAGVSASADSSAGQENNRFTDQGKAKLISISTIKIKPTWGSTIAHGIGNAALAIFWYGSIAVCLVEVMFFAFR